ncbi:MAG TPA: lamin tail domain-containing protein [Candidatus Microsaccharimonas sp.]
MLKVFLGFVVSVVVLLSSAYVPQMISRAYAASATVLITQIQAGGIGAATQEFIVIYNNSTEEVDISGWCLTNKSNAVITCFNPPGVGQEMYLPAHGHAVVASTTFAITQPIGVVTMTYIPTSQSSGSIIGSSDTISLLDHLGSVIDRQTWTTSISAGVQFERHGSGVPVLYQDTDTSADWSVTLPSVLPADETEIDTTIIDICPNIEGTQAILPIGKEFAPTGECVARAIIQLNLSEILPNAVGSDEGQEFIELFNPNNMIVSLANYKLLVGPNYENTYYFPEGSTIQPNGYASFTNTEIPFTLLNSSSRVGLALADDGAVIHEVPAYIDPKDGQSWANINDEWQYTNQPTPGLVNLAADASIPETDAQVTQQPCAVNQYRSLETNRCRLISTGTGSVTPCKDGQYRSEETNRCRNIASDAKTVTPCEEDEERNPDTNRCRKIVSASAPAACKDGQERNPDTNRCRTITKMPGADYGVLGAETKSGGNWYVWAAVGGVLLLAISYAIWEWHDEIGKFFRKSYMHVLRFARLRK